MSSEGDTRGRILEAARELLERRGYHGVGLEEIARAARVSRQAVYLHFGSKSHLLLALVGWVDESEQLQRHFRPVQETADPVRALEQAVRASATYAPKIHRLAMVLLAARESDPAAAAAWKDRMTARRKFCRGLITRLHKSGRLARGWTVTTATDFLWTLISVQTHENVTRECGWSPARAAELLARAAVRSLVD
jgi:AcrR family transcriptional regulator